MAFSFSFLFISFLGLISPGQYFFYYCYTEWISSKAITVAVPARAMGKMHPAKEAPWRALFAKPECLPRTVICTEKNCGTNCAK
jgi:hypothetical protein